MSKKTEVETPKVTATKSKRVTKKQKVKNVEQNETETEVKKPKARTPRVKKEKVVKPANSANKKKAGELKELVKEDK